MRSKKNKVEITLAEQVSNVLGVAERLKGRYVIQKMSEGKWKQAIPVNPLMGDGGLQPPGPPLFGTPTYGSIAEANQIIAQRVARFENKQEMEPPLRVVEASEDCLLTTVYPRTEEAKVKYGQYPKLFEVLEKTPKIVGLSNPTNSDKAPNWVANLAPNELVDVVLDRKGDGISEDCFSTTAAELFAAGYGELHFEKNEYGVTVFVENKEQFNRMQSAV